MGDDLSYGLNTLGPLCLWQCFYPSMFCNIVTFIFMIRYQMLVTFSFWSRIASHESPAVAMTSAITAPPPMAVIQKFEFHATSFSRTLRY